MLEIAVCFSFKTSKIAFINKLTEMYSKQKTKHPSTKSKTKQETHTKKGIKRPFH